MVVGGLKQRDRYGHTCITRIMDRVRLRNSVSSTDGRNSVMPKSVTLLSVN